MTVFFPDSWVVSGNDLELADSLVALQQEGGRAFALNRFR